MSKCRVINCSVFRSTLEIQNFSLRIQNQFVGFCLRSNLSKTEIMFKYLVRFDDHASFVFLLERVRQTGLDDLGHVLNVTAALGRGDWVHERHLQTKTSSYECDWCWGLRWKLFGDWFLDILLTDWCARNNLDKLYLYNISNYSGGSNTERVRNSDGP